MPTIASDDRGHESPRADPVPEPPRASGGPVSAFLLRLGPDRLVFYAEDHAEPAPTGRRRAGRGRLSRTFRRWAAVLWRLARRLGLPVRRAWAWLRWGPDPEESLLRRLRHATGLRLHHPASIPLDSARAAWLDFLAARRNRHLVGLLVNTAISPFTLLLIPIPGPNVIGFWFVYRALSHFWALLGLRRARRLHDSIEFLPAAALDTPIIGAEDEHISEIEGYCDLRHLRAFLKRRGMPRRGSDRPDPGHTGSSGVCK